MTKTEIRRWIRTTREELRALEAALKNDDLDLIGQQAIDMAGTAGEVEVAAGTYVAEQLEKE